MRYEVHYIGALQSKICIDCQGTLVVVPIAKGGLQSVQEVPDRLSLPDSSQIDHHVQSEGPSTDVVSVDAGGTAGVGVLPHAEVAVNESVVKEENGVSGRSIDILHNSTNTVVAPSVYTTLLACSHIGVAGSGVASFDHTGVGVCGLAAVAVTGQAMSSVALAGANVQSDTCESLHIC